MKIPKMMKGMLEKAVIQQCIHAYKQGKDDKEKGEYDEERFEKDLRELINKSI